MENVNAPQNQYSDQTPQQPTSDSLKNNKNFIKIAILAIVTVIIIGIALNYLNIFPIQEKAKDNVSQNQNSSQLQSKVPSPTPIGEFQYDAEKAEVLVRQYVKSEIKPELLPAIFEVKQGLSHDGNIRNIEYQFGSIFNTNNAAISAIFHLKENTNEQNDSSIWIKLDVPLGTTATPSLANSLLSSYFTKPYTVGECQTKGVKSYCEKFQNLSDGNKGYGILLGYDPAKPSLSAVFTCFIPKGSRYYNTLKSCISP